MTRSQITTLSLAAVGMFAVGACTGGQSAYTGKPCDLLKPTDIAAQMGGPVTTLTNAAEPASILATQCDYSAAQDDTVTVSVAGGPTEFEQNIKSVPGLKTLDDVGDRAYLNTSPGAFSQVYVLKGRTYFWVTVDSERTEASAWAVQLARTAATRIK